MTECCAFFSTYYYMIFCWLFHFIDFVLAASLFQECKYHWPWHSGSLLDKPAAHWEPHWTQSGSGDWCTIRIHCFVSDPWIHESAPGEGNEDLPTGPREARKDKRYLMIWKYLKRELIGTNTKQTKVFFIFISCTHSESCCSQDLWRSALSQLHCPSLCSAIAWLEVDGFRTRCADGVTTASWQMNVKLEVKVELKQSIHLVCGNMPGTLDSCRTWIYNALHNDLYSMIYCSKFLLYVFVVPWCKVLRCPSRARQGDQPQCINLIQHVITCHPMSFVGFPNLVTHLFLFRCWW